MKAKLTKNIFFSLCLAMASLFSLNPVRVDASHFPNEKDEQIQALASLVFHLQEIQVACNEGACLDSIHFYDYEIASLWDKATALFYSSADREEIIMFTEAESAYCQGTQLETFGLLDDAKYSYATSSEILTALWENAIDREDSVALATVENVMRSKKIARDPNVEYNPYLSAEIIKQIRPYLLPLNHPMRPILDSLCKVKRITADAKSFAQAGFEIIAKRPRSYIRVASHPRMHNYLVKVYLDTVLQKKQKKESWEWLVLRCEGAEQVKSVIKKKKIQHFIVADKWIYCLPAEPSPPQDALHTRHLALLVVTDMNLASKERNLQAWKSDITTDHLDELYYIISRAKGSSYRPDNITYTDQGKFAFIDTEYPGRGPDFESIRKYLNEEMKDYWDHIVKRGGP